tara:strand:+ start:961 stop:1200 length:240 start_codon:yes stop_codon:yes gene_type:complete
MVKRRKNILLNDSERNCNLFKKRNTKGMIKWIRSRNEIFISFDEFLKNKRKNGIQIRARYGDFSKGEVILIKFKFDIEF